MTDAERRWVLRGMSLARGVLKNIGCPERFHIHVRNYQGAMAEAWHLDASESASEQEKISFMMLTDDINAAIGESHPDWINAAGQTGKDFRRQ